MKKLIAAALVAAVCMAGSGRAYAQIPADKAGLLAGDEMGLAATAELNGYPGPKRILDLSKELKLTPAQQSSIGDIYRDVVKRSKELGKRIISVEEELNEAFKSGLVSEKSIQETSDQIAKLRGRLRAEQLIAHLKTRALLTDPQIKLYASLRSPKPGTKK